MESFIIIIHVIAAIGIIGLVLIQHGKGADMGASFGSGASQTVFGSLGAGTVLTKSTTILAVTFFITSLGLAMVARQAADQNLQTNGLIENIDQVTSAINTDAEAALQDALTEFTGANNDIPVVNSAEVDVNIDLPTIDDLPVVEAAVELLEE